jgi:hypothetical protein
VPHPCPAPVAPGRPRFEVAEIFRTHGAAYRQRHALGRRQRQAMWAIEHCRTATLGGHRDVCLACGHEQPSYNSCRDRHCPKCQALAQAAWLAQRQERVLPTYHFHVVFTLPAELRALCRWNPVALYDLLFACATQTLLDFGRGELGAQLGITAVLHTWTRDLRLHPHLHCVVTGGGLSHVGAHWVATGPRFLFPVMALAKRFRGKVLARLRALRAADSLVYGGGCADLAAARGFRRLLDTLARTPWVVYAKRPFGGTAQVFAYLGRYTHRVAISNARLVAVDHETVRFRTRDGRHATLSPERFIGRFLLHVLPRRFVKTRHYGLLAGRNVTTRLEQARAQLLAAAAPPAAPVAPPPSAPPDWRTVLAQLTGLDLSVCPRCGGPRVRLPLDTLPHEARTITTCAHDTS